MRAPTATTPPDLLPGLHGLLPRGARVLAAVSGGSDSVALLAACRAPLAGRLTVVHVRHGLRAAGERDAAFVRALCERLDLPCVLLDAAPTPGAPGRTETAARARRLAALSAAARQLDAPWVLLAHHLDDDLETLLLRLRRGHAGDRALAGMPTLRPLAPGAFVVRPFLVGARPPGRAELAALRVAAGLPHVEDETNADRRIARNAARAWLAGQAAATRVELLALRARARARLAARLRGAASAIERHLHAEGLGARLDAPALQPPPGEPAAEWRAELLRLVAAALARPRRLDPRGAVLAQLDERLARGGALTLPAEPCALHVRIRAGALHLPGEPLAESDPGARALSALLAGPALL